MATKSPAQSILKKTTSTVLTAASTVTKQQERDRQNRQIAVEHALVIEHQKDIQATLLSSIQTLMDFPTTSPFTVAEANTFITLVATFQPSDFDDLVEERKVDGRCGFVLCSNAPRTLEPNRAWRLPKGAQNWCSTSCAKKGLYVRTQLSEVPAWERRPGETPEIVLHGDDRTLTAFQNVQNGALSASVFTEQGELAVERGEQAASLRPKQVMSDSIVEKPMTKASDTKVTFSDESSTAIEGYEPKAPLIEVQDQRTEAEDLSFWDLIDHRGMGVNNHRGTGLLEDDDDEDRDQG